MRTKMEALDQEAKLKELYQESVKKFSDRWAEGFYDRIETEDPALMTNLTHARISLDNVWIAVRSGKAGMSEFKKALQEWENLHLKALGPIKMKELI
jgi:hypothetical protein